MEPKTPTQLLVEGFDASGVSYGDHINHTDIENWSGIECPDVARYSKVEQKKAIQKYALEKLTAVEGLKRYALEERMMYFVPVPGSGYRIVEPSEQTVAAVEKGLRVVEKGLKHAARGVHQVNVAMLTSDQREFNATSKSKLAALALMMGRKKDYLSLK